MPSAVDSRVARSVCSLSRRACSAFFSSVTLREMSCSPATLPPLRMTDARHSITTSVPSFDKQTNSMGAIGLPRKQRDEEAEILGDVLQAENAQFPEWLAHDFFGQCNPQCRRITPLVEETRPRQSRVTIASGASSIRAR